MCRCTPEVWQPELLTQVRIRLLPCVLQVSEAAAFACDPAKETQETVFQSVGLLIIHSQFCHLRDRSAWIHILLIRVLKLTQLGPLRAVSTLCTQAMYHVSVHLTASTDFSCAFVITCEAMYFSNGLSTLGELIIGLSLRLSCGGSSFSRCLPLKLWTTHTT